MLARLKLAALALIVATLPAAAQPAVRPKVVATFTILADLVRQIGGDRIETISLVGANVDAHSFAPKPSDVQSLGQAKLVVVNGLGFDAWAQRLVKTAGYKGEVLVATAGITPRKAEGEHAGHDHGDEETDPHAWQNPANVKVYVANLRDGLIRIDPEGRDVYAARTEAYLKQLDAVRREMSALFDAIPKERRRVVSSHDAFGYFASAFGIEFLAAQGVSSEGDISAKRLAALIRQIRTLKAPAVFLENLSDPRLAERIARETGAKIGGTLYADALTPADGPAPTYLDMMRHNARTISEALK